MDLDTVTFEDLFQLSPEPQSGIPATVPTGDRSESHHNNKDSYQAGYNNLHQQSTSQQENQATARKGDDGIIADLDELEHQLTELQNAQHAAYSVGYNAHDQQSQSLQHSSNPQIQSKVGNWIDVPHASHHSRSGSDGSSLFVSGGNTGGLCVGSSGSTLVVGSSGSTGSLDEHFAAGSYTGHSDDGGVDPRPHSGRGGRRRRGGGRGPAGETYKLERSRQSARECRARKKLRYQYLDDTILERERANMVLRQELEKYVNWCAELDKGRLPDGWDNFIQESKVKQEVNEEY